jgi:excisionase family DNA binding protein
MTEVIPLEMLERLASMVADRLANVSPPIAQQQRLLVSVKDAQSIIGRSRWTVYNLIARGEIEAVKAGSSTLVKTDSLRRYVDGLAPAKVKPLLQKAQRERARREAVA